MLRNGYVLSLAGSGPASYIAEGWQVLSASIARGVHPLWVPSGSISLLTEMVSPPAQRVAHLIDVAESVVNTGHARKRSACVV